MNQRCAIFIIISYEKDGLLVKRKIHMTGKVKNQVSAIDVKTVRASLVTPIVVTIFCFALDIVVHIKFQMVSISTVKEFLFWSLGTLISYFFPSFIAASITLLCQYYFAESWSGIKAGKGMRLFIGTLIFFFLYIVYLLFADTYYIIIFAVINIGYAFFVAENCIDPRIFRRIAGEPGGKVSNSPS